MIVNPEVTGETNQDLQMGHTWVGAVVEEVVA